MKNKIGHYRHGDVLIIPATIPDKAEKASGDKIILAEAEVTGHKHQIEKGAVMFKFNEKTYLRVTEGLATLKHEEHKALTIPAGDYEIKIQQDYEPSGWKKVQD